MAVGRFPTNIKVIFKAVGGSDCTEEIADHIREKLRDTVALRVVTFHHWQIDAVVHCDSEEQCKQLMKTARRLAKGQPPLRVYAYMYWAEDGTWTPRTGEFDRSHSGRWLWLSAPDLRHIAQEIFGR